MVYPFDATRSPSNRAPALVEALVVGLGAPGRPSGVRVRVPTRAGAGDAVWVGVPAGGPGVGGRDLPMPGVGDEVLLCAPGGDLDAAVVVGLLSDGRPRTGRAAPGPSPRHVVGPGGGPAGARTACSEKITLATVDGSVSIVWDAGQRRLTVESRGGLGQGAAGDVRVRCREYTLSAVSLAGLSAGGAFRVPVDRSAGSAEVAWLPRSAA